MTSLRRSRGRSRSERRTSRNDGSMRHCYSNLALTRGMPQSPIGTAAKARPGQAQSHTGHTLAPCRRCCSSLMRPIRLWRWRESVSRSNGEGPLCRSASVPQTSPLLTRSPTKPRRHLPLGLAAPLLVAQPVNRISDLSRLFPGDEVSETWNGESNLPVFRGINETLCDQVRSYGPERVRILT